MAKKIDREELERQILMQIKHGFSRPADISARLKMATSTVEKCLRDMHDAGQLQRQTFDGKHHYSKFSTPAHDPFGLCPKKES